MTAQPLTAAEAAVERVARALSEAPGRDGWPLLCMTPEDVRVLAEAALTVMRPAPDTAKTDVR